MDHSSLIDRYFDLKDRFHEETDRGMSVLVCSYLDILLEHLVKKQMQKIKVTDSLFKGYGPLATFSAKINLCYSLGNFDAFQYREFSTIKKIRNRFAHEVDGVSFKSQDVTQMCNELGFCKEIETQIKPQMCCKFICCLVCEISDSVFICFASSLAKATNLGSCFAFFVSDELP